MASKESKNKTEKPATKKAATKKRPGVKYADMSETQQRMFRTALTHMSTSAAERAMKEAEFSPKKSTIKANLTYLLSGVTANVFGSHVPTSSGLSERLFKEVSKLLQERLASEPMKLTVDGREFVIEVKMPKGKP